MKNISMNFQVSSTIESIICDFGKIKNTNKNYIEIAQVVEIENGYLFIQYNLFSNHNQSFNDLIEDYKKMDNLNLNNKNIDILQLSFHIIEDRAIYKLDNLKDFGYYTTDTVVSEYNEIFC